MSNQNTKDSNRQTLQIKQYPGDYRRPIPEMGTEGGALATRTTLMVLIQSIEDDGLKVASALSKAANDYIVPAELDTLFPHEALGKLRESIISILEGNTPNSRQDNLRSYHEKEGTLLKQTATFVTALDHWLENHRDSENKSKQGLMELRQELGRAHRLATMIHENIIRLAKQTLMTFEHADENITNTIKSLLAASNGMADENARLSNELVSARIKLTENAVARQKAEEQVQEYKVMAESFIGQTREVTLRNDTLIRTLNQVIQAIESGEITEQLYHQLLEIRAIATKSEINLNSEKQAPNNDPGSGLPNSVNVAGLSPNFSSHLNMPVIDLSKDNQGEMESSWFRDLLNLTGSYPQTITAIHPGITQEDMELINAHATNGRLAEAWFNRRFGELFSAGGYPIDYVKSLGSTHQGKAENGMLLFPSQDTFTTGKLEDLPINKIIERQLKPEEEIGEAKNWLIHTDGRFSVLVEHPQGEQLKEQLIGNGNLKSVEYRNTSHLYGILTIRPNVKFATIEINSIVAGKHPVKANSGRSLKEKQIILQALQQSFQEAIERKTTPSLIGNQQSNVLPGQHGVSATELNAISNHPHK